MNDDDYSDLASDHLNLIDDVCSTFDLALQAGQTTSVVELTESVPAELRPHLQKEMLATEIHYLRSQHREPNVRELSQRFPDVREEAIRNFVEATDLGPGDTASFEQTRTEGTASVTKPESGLQQIGPYELVEEIGRGGMGIVYQAVHTRLGKTVALKILPTSIASHTEAVARFQREMKAIGALEHPNIVAATDAGEIDGTHFLVMEYVRGMDLSSLLRRDISIPFAGAAEIIRQAACGLQAAFEKGMVHRDIKPSNLILAQAPSSGADVTVKILDLGLAQLNHEVAQHQSELSGSNTFIGTAIYMAPEQGDSSRVDIRADIYSLGCTLYRMLTGRLPFSQSEYESPLKLLIAKSTKDAPSVRSLRSDLPRDLSQAVDRMLARDPDERYHEPREVEKALEHFCRDADLYGLLHNVSSKSACAAVSNPPVPLPAMKTPRRNRLLAGCVAVAFALVVGIVGSFGPDKSSTPEQHAIPSENEHQDPIRTFWTFDGKTSFVHVPDMRRNGLEHMTLEVWVRPKPQEHARVICHLFDSPRLQLGRHDNMLFGMDGLTEPAYPEALSDGDRVAKFNQNERRWHHLAIVISPAETRLYLDGRRCWTMPRTRTPEPVEPIGFYIGAEPLRGKMDFHYFGDIDEVRLTAAECYTADFDPRPRLSASDDTILLFHFDDLSEDTLTDSSGNGHHGQVFGGLRQ